MNNLNPHKLNLIRSATSDSNEAYRDKRFFKTKRGKFVKVLLILIAIPIALVIAFHLFVRIEVTLFFGEQPIMDRKLLGMKLKSQDFESGKYRLLDLGKPTSYSMSNCFKRPETLTPVESVKSVMAKAEEYGWEFLEENKYKLDHPDPDYSLENNYFSEPSIASKMRDGKYISIYSPQFSNQNIPKEICISIRSEIKNW